MSNRKSPPRAWPAGIWPFDKSISIRHRLPRRAALELQPDFRQAALNIDASNEQLAAILTGYGVPVSKSTIGDIRTGKLAMPRYDVGAALLVLAIDGEGNDS